MLSGAGAAAAQSIVLSGAGAAVVRSIAPGTGAPAVRSIASGAGAGAARSIVLAGAGPDCDAAAGAHRERDGGIPRRRREARRLAVVTQDAEHAPHVGESLARVGGDLREQPARGRVLADRQQALQLLRLAHDQAQDVGNRRVQVGGDPHPLLLGGVERVALALALEALRLFPELVLQQHLAADPAPDEQRHRDRDRRQDHVCGALHRRVEGGARGDEDRHRDHGPGETPRSGDVTTGRVEREHEDRKRSHRVADEEAVQRGLDQQHARDREEGREGRAVPPGQRRRGDGQRQRAHELAAVAGREQDLELPRDGQRRCHEEVAPKRLVGARDAAEESSHDVTVTPGDRAALVLARIVHQPVAALMVGAAELSA
jgi:hypothetical protein